MARARRLHLAPGFSLPLEVVTEAIAFLGKRGSGKTHNSSVLVEEVLDVGVQVVVLDPMDAWWGLRSSADGKGAGYPVAILGGPHGDIPLESTGGRVVADFLVEVPASVVLCMKDFSKNERRRFVTDFLARFYQRRTAEMEPVLVVLEEADLFAPERSDAGDNPMLGAVYDLVRRGRGVGMGSVMLCQRVAALSKGVLEQAEVLAVHRTPGPNDRKAIARWVDVHGDEHGKEVLESLPSLPTGEAWFWWPVEEVLERVTVRKRHTFDSSATPKVGQRTAAPKTLADVDLASIKEQMAETIERARADDPKELRSRIGHLEKDLAAARKATPAPERVEVPVIDEATMARLDDLALRYRELVAGAVRSIGEAVAPVAEALDAIRDRSSRSGDSARITAIRDRPPAVRTPAVRRAPAASAAPAAPLDGVSGPQQRILDSLAWFEGVGIAAVDRTQLALFAGASPKSSAFGNNLGSLRSAGMIDYPGRGTVTLTDAGRAVATPADDIRTSEDLHAALFSKLSGPQVRILEVLIGAYPDSVDRTELAELAGASPTSSAFGNNLGALRSLGLIDYPERGQVVALPVLFLT